MTDPQALQNAVSLRIATEFGQNRLALIEVQEVLQAAHQQVAMLTSQLEAVTAERDELKREPPKD